MNLKEWESRIYTEDFLEKIRPLYGEQAAANVKRFEKLLSLFRESFGDADQIALFSAPGRTEIGGNHTDHQHGRVLAASVELDMIAAVHVTGTNEIRVSSEGYPQFTVRVDELDAVEEEKNTTAALVRGVVSAFAGMGARISGFDIALTSSVLRGSGISSSAAFEVLVGNVVNDLFFDSGVDAVKIAQIGQYAENVYFGKPSGLMDQMASSVGNLLTIDFEDPANPIVTKLDVDFEKTGLALCIIDSGADHADLTDEYAAVPNEIKKICTLMGRDVLRQIPEEEFIENIPRLRAAAGDRAILRAIHFYEDNDRVPKQAKALQDGDLDTFLALVKESGRSSWMYLQNIIPAGYKEHQEMGVVLALCDLLLGDKGAYRVHGGGFAGTCQAFVPKEILGDFKKRIEQILGEGHCHVLSIRSVGGVRIG